MQSSLFFLAFHKAGFIHAEMICQGNHTSVQVIAARKVSPPHKIDSFCLHVRKSLKTKSQLTNFSSQLTLLSKDIASSTSEQECLPHLCIRCTPDGSRLLSQPPALLANGLPGTIMQKARTHPRSHDTCFSIHQEHTVSGIRQLGFHVVKTKRSDLLSA